jgi:hypothetical protein
VLPAFVSFRNMFTDHSCTCIQGSTIHFKGTVCSSFRNMFTDHSCIQGSTVHFKGTVCSCHLGTCLPTTLVFRAVQYILKNCMFVILIFNTPHVYRSQWPRDLRHELFSLTGTLGSWVRTPLKAWISVCVYSVFCVVLCVDRGLATC